jgi:hypothetical protein
MERRQQQQQLYDERGSRGSVKNQDTVVFEWVQSLVS